MATAAEIQAALSAYKTARDDIVGGRVTSVQVAGQSYTFLSLPEIEKQITIYENRLAAVQASSTQGRFLGIRGRLGGMGY